MWHSALPIGKSLTGYPSVPARFVATSPVCLGNWASSPNATAIFAVRYELDQSSSPQPTGSENACRIEQTSIQSGGRSRRILVLVPSWPQAIDQQPVAGRHSGPRQATAVSSARSGGLSRPIFPRRSHH